MDSQILEIEENPFLPLPMDTSFYILTLYEYIKKYVKSTKSTYVYVNLQHTLLCVPLCVWLNFSYTFNFFTGDFFIYDIQHCFICRPSDSTVSEDAGIKPRTVALALTT